MSIIEFTRQDFESLSENVARVKLSNMYTIDNPLSLSGYSYVPRPTLTKFTEVVGGAIRGIWYQSAQGTTIIYVLAGQTLYTLNKSTGETTLIGTIPGTDVCTFASTIYHIAIAANRVLYLYDGLSITEVIIPDNQKVSDVTSLDNYFVVSIENSNKFYWIAPGETIIDPLSFASAERNPDDIVSIETTGDEMWALGQRTCEVFADSGDQNAPFVRISGRAYEIGCIDKHSVVRTIYQSLPCLIWVTPNKEVILAQGSPTKISDESVEEILKRSSLFTAWSFKTNRHDFYVLTTDVCTLVFDINVNKWYRWNTYLKNTWDAVSGINIDDDVFCTTTVDGIIYKLVYNSVDVGTDYLVCEVSGFIPNISSKPTLCNYITLFLNYGFSGQYLVAPVIEIRWSDDGGHTWSTYMQGSTGSRGAYDTNIIFRSLGKISQPGRQIEVRFSEIQTFRLDGATMNE